MGRNTQYESEQLISYQGRFKPTLKLSQGDFPSRTPQQPFVNEFWRDDEMFCLQLNLFQV